MLDFLKANLSWMLVALCMSLILWATVAAQQNPDVSTFVGGIPVELRDRPSGLVATSPVLPVNVDVQAPLDALPRLGPTTFRAHIDLGGATPGVQEFPVRVEASDRRVRIEKVTPEKMTLRLEAIKKREVPVRLNVVDNPPFGYVAKGAHATPMQVTISGPEGQVDRVTAAVVEIRLDNVRASIREPLRPVPENNDGEQIPDVTTTPENVLVEVPIEQQLAYKAVPVAPQIAGSVALGYQIIGIQVDPTIVTAVGDPSVLDETPFLSTKPVDVTGTSSDIVANGELALPNGVSLVRRQPITVRVYVSPVEANKVVRVATQVKGLGDRLKADPNPNTVDVTISGPMPLLTTLRPQDVQATVDVTGISSGTRLVTVTVTVAAALRVDDASPKQVSVTIQPQ